MQAEFILAAAHRELDSVRAILDILGGSIADCAAAVATARHHLGIGGYGENRERSVVFLNLKKINQVLFYRRHFILAVMHESVIRTSRPFMFSLAVDSFLICAPGVKAAGGLYCERSLGQCATRSFEQLGCISGIVVEYI